MVGLAPGIHGTDAEMHEAAWKMAQAQSAVMGNPAPHDPPALVSLVDQMIRHQNALAAIVERTQAAADRAFGSVPREVRPDPGAHQVIGSRVGELTAVADIIGFQLGELAREIERIEQLV